MKKYLYKPKHLKELDQQLKDKNKNKSFLNKIMKSIKKLSK